MKIGFIGQGWIGKNYADNLEDRGYDVIRYALEEPHIKNKDKIKDCDVVFIAVPTPTTPEHGYDDSIVVDSLKLIGKGNIAVIRSTLIPGRTVQLQEMYKEITILFVPEFLTRATVKKDVETPERKVIGLPIDDEAHRAAAKTVQELLPSAQYEAVCSSGEAEVIKYARNTLGAARTIFMNLIYEVSENVEADWSVVESAMMADPINGGYYLSPVQQGGRGAGGPCFIKDLAAFADYYEKNIDDEVGKKMIRAIEEKNRQLLRDSGKDLDLLDGVYGTKK